MRRKGTRMILQVWIALLMCTAVMLSAAAADGTVSCREAVADEKTVKAYIGGASGTEDIKYQIGNIPAEDLTLYHASEDSVPIRTLLMLDNSLSIPGGDREKIGALLKGIIDAHAENEVFRLATFAGETSYLTDSYSGDYTALKNILESISYSDQETYLTDVLYAVVGDLNEERYMGYTRIVMISDGVDNNPAGVTREELNGKLEETRYPVYTVGVRTKGNETLLKNMYAISRQTGCPYWTLDEQDPQEIAAQIAQESDLTVLEAVIPEEAKTGGTQSSRLTLDGDTEIVFDVSMPFSIRETPAATEERPAETKAETTAETVPETEPEPEKSAGNIRPLIVGIASFAVAFVLFAILFSVLRGKKKKKTPEREIRPDPALGPASATEIMGGQGSRQSSVLPGGGDKTAYRLTLTDTRDFSRTFQCELRGTVNIGRAGGNDIVISDDRSVSGKHCMIVNKSGRFFIQDLGSTNKTVLNGKQVLTETEIFPGSIIKLGKTELSVKIDRFS